MTIPEQAVEAAAKAHYETQPEFRERFEGGREPIPFAELPEGSRRYRLRNQRIALEAAQPLMGVERQELIAVLQEAADFLDPDRDPPRITNRQMAERIRSILALPHTGQPQEGWRRILSHEDVARELLAGAALDYGNQLGVDHLRRAITKGLQHAFDLGFRAAGGSVSTAPPPPVAESESTPFPTDWTSNANSPVIAEERPEVK